MDRIKDINIKIQPYGIGWLDFTIQDKTFHVSYLSDFIEDMRGLLVFGKDKDYNPCEVHRTYFDGEGIDLYITTWIDLDSLFLTWEHYNKHGELDIKTFRFDYDKFMKVFENEFSRVKDLYYTIFNLDSLDK